jgi:hypothetical protein
MIKLTKMTDSQKWIVRNEENKILMVQVGREVFYLKHAFTIDSLKELKDLLDNPHIELRLLKEALN